MKTKIIYLVITCFILSIVFIQYTAAENVITMDFYYSESCGTCDDYIPIIDEIETNYTGILMVHRKEVGSNNTNWQEWNNHGFQDYPSVIINNETKIPSSNITYENLENIVNNYVEQLDLDEQNTLFGISNMTIERLLAIIILFFFTTISIYLIITTGEKS